METKLEAAIEALRGVAQEQLMGMAGVFNPIIAMTPAQAGVFTTLAELGEVETIERTEPYSGSNQTIWQGCRLRDWSRPSRLESTLLKLHK